VARSPDLHARGKGKRSSVGQANSLRKERSAGLRRRRTNTINQGIVHLTRIAAGWEKGPTLGPEREKRFYQERLISSLKRGPLLEPFFRGPPMGEKSRGIDYKKDRGLGAGGSR